MNKETLIRTAKHFRKDADDLLQRMKEHAQALKFNAKTLEAENVAEIIAQHILSQRDLEACIMRQGMVLKNIGVTNPYPESKNPESPVVHPTSGVKL